eukprot:gene7454-15245_t
MLFLFNLLLSATSLEGHTLTNKLASAPANVRGTAFLDKLTFKDKLSDNIVIELTSSGLILRRSNDESMLQIHSSINGPIVESDIYPLTSMTTDNIKTNAEAIFGIFELSSGNYIAVITKSFPADYIGTGVREIKEVDLIPIPSKLNLNQENDIKFLTLKAKDELKLLQKAFKRHTFYFSTSSYDVTKNTQSNYLQTISNIPQHQWNTSDNKFFWNFNLITPFINSKSYDWITPITNAWTATKEFNLNNKEYSLTLISRRSRSMQGPRYIKRGIDTSGDVANFVETEQILRQSDNTALMAFTQIRGSIPLFWSQPLTWHLQPNIQILGDNTDGSSSNDNNSESSASNDSSSSDNDGSDSTVSNGISSSHMKALKLHLIDLHKNYIEKTKNLYHSHILIQKDSTSNKNNILQQQQLESSSRSSNTNAIANNGNMGRISIVNLIDKKKAQGKLGKLFTHSLRQLSRNKININIEENENIDNKFGISDREVLSVENHKFPLQLNEVEVEVEDICNVQYIWFDFHKKCKGGKTDNLLELHTPVRDILEGNQSCFSIICNDNKDDKEKNNDDVKTSVITSDDSDGDIDVRFQRDIIRTNCIDCLDRTNVVQTLMARWALLRQFRILGAIPPHNGESETAVMAIPDKEVEGMFRRMWGDNGDHMSELYAGTRALKRDVTRHGRRTSKGAFDDGLNSAIRYYVNNFKDHRRQKALDLMLGLGLGLGNGVGVSSQRKPLLALSPVENGNVNGNESDESKVTNGVHERNSITSSSSGMDEGNSVDDATVSTETETETKVLGMEELSDTMTMTGGEGEDEGEGEGEGERQLDGDGSGHEGGTRGESQNQDDGEDIDYSKTLTDDNTVVDHSHTSTSMSTSTSSDGSDGSAYVEKDSTSSIADLEVLYKNMEKSFQEQTHDIESLLDDMLKSDDSSVELSDKSTLKSTPSNSNISNNNTKKRTTKTNVHTTTSAVENEEKVEDDLLDISNRKTSGKLNKSLGENRNATSTSMAVKSEGILVEFFKRNRVIFSCICILINAVIFYIRRKSIGRFDGKLF